MDEKGKDREEGVEDEGIKRLKSMNETLDEEEGVRGSWRRIMGQ